MAFTKTKHKELRLPSSLNSEIGGEDFDEKKWRESHNIGGKRKSRKESRKEQRQAKKLKKLPSHVLERQHADYKPAGAKGNGRKDQPQKSEQPMGGGREESKKMSRENSKEKSKLKSDRVLRPFLTAQQMEQQSRVDDDVDYYAKKLGLPPSKSKKGSNAKQNDGLGDLLDGLEFEDDDEDAELNTESSEEDDFQLPESDSDEVPLTRSLRKPGASMSPKDTFDSESSESDGDDAAAKTMAKLAALKAKGSEGRSAPPPSELRIVKEDELGLDDDPLSDEYDFDGSDENLDEDDESGDMTAEETMAKLAALKNNRKAQQKSKKAALPESDDSLSSDDFESDEGSDEEEDEGSMTAEETMAKLAALKAKKNARPTSDITAGDDSLSEGDFSQDSTDESDGGEMTAEETMAKLAALKAKKQQPPKSLGNANNATESSDDMASDSSSDEDSDAEENPYVPPTRRQGPSGEGHGSVGLRSEQDNEEVVKMRRSFKGSLNKLTESTLGHVSHEIELVFLRSSRAEASRVLTEELVELVGGQKGLQHTLFTVYAGLLAALYQSIGVNFAAHFVQTVVEKIIQAPEESINALTLLIESYSLHITSSRLPYDLMKRFLNDIRDEGAETPVELLLVIIRTGGPQLRSDDPVALKELITLLQRRMQQLGGASGSISPRMRFLVDTIVALKNNRQRPVSELVVSLRHRIMKQLHASRNNTTWKEPLQVGLSDILDSKTRGKWWLVGASWKGQGAAGSQVDQDKLDIDIDDEFGASTPDWLELAKKQRLNTDVRRAVFVALMGAEDYLDACLRIDKLGLKNKQERDVPHVILHCLGQEPYYNPYYALVAGKQCARHSLMKTFQFRLWDWLSSEPRGNPQLAMHFGRFYAALVSQKAMPLDVLKAVDFLGMSGDTRVFVEVFFVTLYRDLAKQAEKDAKQRMHRGLANIDLGKASSAERDGRELTLLLTKIRDEKVLRGIQLANRTVAASEAVQNDKDRARVTWAAGMASDLIDELVDGSRLVD